MNRARTVLGWLSPVVVGLVGAWLALMAIGGATSSMGPFDVRLHPSFGRGETTIHLPPLGSVTADTHTAPLRLRATVEGVDIDDLGNRLAERTVRDVVDDVERDARDRLGPMVLRTIGVATAGALVVAVAVFRRRLGRVAIVVLTALLVTSVSTVAAWRTFEPAAFQEPRFSGALALAPQLVGPVEEATSRIEAFRRELERIVSGAVRVYANIELPASGDAAELRVLHVSDIHLSPLGLDFALSLARGFDVDLVIDTGDLSSFGTTPERLLLSPIEQVGRPYLFVRGNHDSPALQASLAQMGNVVVLDGEARTVEGLTVYGLGHPVLTADKREEIDFTRFVGEARKAGERVAADVASIGDVNVVAVHDDTMAEDVAGEVPVVLSGHRHRTEMHISSGTIYLRIGSTGGGGLDVFAQRGGLLEAQILSFTRTEPPRLVAVDRVTQTPEAGRLVVQRQRIDEHSRSTPSPASSPTVSPTAVP